MGVTPADLAGGFGLPGVPDVPGLSGRIEDNFRPAAGGSAGRHPAADAGRRGGASRRADASVEGGGGARIGAEALAPAMDAGLLTIGERVTFRHPLVRSAVYRAASPAERGRAQALAGATDPRPTRSPCLAPQRAR